MQIVSLPLTDAHLILLYNINYSLNENSGTFLPALHSFMQIASVSGLYQEKVSDSKLQDAVKCLVT